MPTAVLVDGEFFLRRHHWLRGSCSPKEVANDLHWVCMRHVKRDKRRLYRIFFYDCLPLTKRVHNPVTNRCIDFSKTPLAQWRLGFHEELKKLRKVAIRRGVLVDRPRWLLDAEVTKKLLRREMTVDQIAETDVVYDVRQKGVDMRIGLDIASMAFKRQVDQIVLIAGDSDFVPAAKLARREGLDFILDPMRCPIRADLHEHIDGLRTFLSNRKNEPLTAPAPPAVPTPAPNPIDGDGRE